jgi:hypothetical protein
MGMNTGVQDAYNLGWKLALVVAGAADEALLDTYEAERRPVAEDVLRSTGPSTGLIASTNPVVGALRDHVLGPILERERVQARLLNATTGLDVDYRGSSLSRTSTASPLDELLDTADLRGVVERGWRTWRAPRAGDRLLDGPCERPDGSETSLHDVLHGETGFSLLLFTGTDGAGDALDASFDRVSAVLDGELLRSYRVVPEGAAVDERPGVETAVDVDGTLHRRYGAVAPVLYVIRPDDYVGFRAAVSNDVPLAEYFREAIGLATAGERAAPRQSN